MKKNLLLFLLFFIPVSAVFSQSDYREGYIVTNDLDTIHGLIDFRSEIRNSSVCEFKADENSETRSYLPGEINSYRFTDHKYYFSHEIESGDQKKMIFIEFLLNGIFNLYYYRDINGPHYLVESDDGRLYELTNEQKEIVEEGKTYLGSTNKHIGILKAALSDCPEIFPQIEKVKLNHQSLISLTKDYHNYVCEDEECIVYEKALPPVIIKFSPVIELSSSELLLEKDVYYTNFAFAKRQNFHAGLSMKFILPRMNRNLSVQLDVMAADSYYHGFYEVSRYMYNNYFDIHYSGISLKTSALAKYTYPKGKIRPTFAIGGVIQNMLSMQVRVDEEERFFDLVETTHTYDLPMAKTLMGFSAQAGLDYHLAGNFAFFTNLRFSNLIGENADLRTHIINYNLVFGIYF